MDVQRASSDISIAVIIWRRHPLSRRRYIELTITRLASATKINKAPIAVKTSRNNGGKQAAAPAHRRRKFRRHFSVSYRSLHIKSHCYEILCPVRAV
jgi:hypothetical protein